MNKEEPIRDQAEKLRKRMKNVDQKVDSIDSAITVQKNEKLPPRSRVHKQKHMQKKTKIKVKYPLIRLLGMFFILLPILIFSIYSYNESQSTPSSTPVEESKGAEAVYYTEEEEEVKETGAEEEVEENSVTEEESITDEKVVTGEAETIKEEPQITEQTMEPETAKETNTSGTVSSGGTQAAPVDQTVVYHKVQPGETIFRLAMKYYKSQAGIDIIKKANSLPSNEISVGQTLTIPLSK
jgi:cytoskeletal protein RodZ